MISINNNDMKNDNAIISNIEYHYHYRYKISNITPSMS
ncbi:hypothetical protein RS022_01980 [Candidatus Phytoplasma rubi]|uniref:Uncharacterized protein n=1 Tax=Candidatus Phytoplasma rubi TaxID=399025 RepID=A0ABY7BSW7_9MOLU|nr:hypothetical protein RS022_01810 [Candidatus Phytoplasma rubi]WAN63172.1 hypothetical protein RS022_01980 [Candidatus Phytoplasma rubi]